MGNGGSSIAKSGGGIAYSGGGIATISQTKDSTLVLLLLSNLLFLLLLSVSDDAQSEDKDSLEQKISVLQ